MPYFDGQKKFPLFVKRFLSSLAIVDPELEKLSRDKDLREILLKVYCDILKSRLPYFLYVAQKPIVPFGHLSFP